MKFYFQQEIEVKLLVGSIQDLSEVDAWIKARAFSDLGLAKFRRNYVYYDFHDHRLSSADLSFRQKFGKASYCFKYPLHRHGDLRVRKEVFTILSECSLNIRNPFHRRLPVVERMLSALDMKVIDPNCLPSLMPQVRIECDRKYRMIVNEIGDRIMGVAYDEVRAFPADADFPFAEWFEVELEVQGASMEGLELAQHLANDLVSNGLRISDLGKYRLAMEKRGC